MKKKSTAMLSVLMCLVLLVSTFAACSIKDNTKDSTTTTLLPNESWQAGVPDTYEPITINKVELVGLVSEALGDDAEGFNGDLNTLTPEQQEKVEQLAQDKGFIIDKDESGNTVIKKEPTTQATPEEISSIFNEVSVKDPSKVTPSEYEEISSLAQENGMTAVTNQQGQVDVVKPVTRPATTTNPFINNTTAGNKPTAPVTYPPTKPVVTSPYEPPSYATSRPLDPIGTLPPKIEKASVNWFANYGKTDINYILSSSDLAADGGVVSAGTFIQMNETGEAIKISGSFLVKMDEKGKVKFQDTISGDDLTVYQDVAVLKDGSIVAVGYTTSSNLVSDAEYKCKGTAEGLIVKYSKKGEREWIKLFGGSESDEFYSVAATPDGGFVVGGMSYSSDLDVKGLTSYEVKAVLVKYTANGSISWKKALAGEDASSVDGLDFNNSGVIFASISTSVPDGDYAGLPIVGNGMSTIATAFSANGQVLWMKAISDEGPAELPKIIATSDGGCVLAGDYASGKEGNKHFFKGIYAGGPYGTYDGIMVKFNSKGATSWITPIKGYESDFISDIAEVSGGYVVSGYSASGNRDFAGSSSQNGDFNSFVYAINTYGERQTMNSFGGSRSDFARTICSDGNKKVYVCGSTNSSDGFTADFAVKGTDSVETGFIALVSITNK